MGSLRPLWVVSLAISSCGPGEFDPSNPTRTASSSDVKDRGTSDVPATSEKRFDLAACGFDADKPSSLALSQRLSMDTFKKTIVTSPFGGGVFTKEVPITFSAGLVLEASLTSHVLTYSGSASPAEYDSNATVSSTLSHLKGATTATIIDSVSRAKIGETYAEWAGVFCALQPAKQLASTAGRRVAVTFNQPIPFGVLPIANLERMKLELSKKRTFTKLEGKVTESDDKAAPVGMAFQGSVAAELVPVEQIKNAKGEIAIKITYDFGGDDKLKLMGLPKTVVWVVDSAAKTIGGIQITPPTGDVMTFR